MLIHNGYKYIREYSRGLNTYWCCKEFRTKIKCRGRSKTVGDRIIETQPHTCIPSSSVEELLNGSYIVQKPQGCNTLPSDGGRESVAGFLNFLFDGGLIVRVGFFSFPKIPLHLRLTFY
ncbi:unnamed protein product [Meloidogyne enterolobii]|uniref:Uncharacterized protein n=1 Tax=Meloidogyne enterolobii TaxID=390850 RepID=A0ACB0ZM49_MELEN